MLLTADTPQRYKDQKDAILFAILVSPSMLAEHQPASLKERPTSAIRTALECAYSVLQARIIATPHDIMGILFFGTEESNYNGFDNCYLQMDLDVPDADSIKDLKRLLEDEDMFAERLKP